MNKAELLRNIKTERETWNELLLQISPSIMDHPGIMGAWTLRDLIAHITWTEAETALLVRNRSLAQNSPWWGLPLDERNQKIYDQHKNDSLEAVEVRSIQVFADLIAAIETLTDADLDIELIAGVPLWEQISRNTYGHYRQHAPDVEEFIASTNVQPSVKELTSRMQHGWDKFQAYLKTLSEDQQTRLTDAAGWTIKDHIMHLAVWEDGIYGMFSNHPRHIQMGLDDAAWDTDGYDIKNDIIYKQHKDKSLAEVMKAFQDIHNRLIAKIQTLNDEDLMRPYKYYEPNSTNEQPVIGFVVGNTFGHYMEHTSWIATIALS